MLKYEEYLAQTTEERKWILIEEEGGKEISLCIGDRVRITDCEAREVECNIEGIMYLAYGIFLMTEEPVDFMRSLSSAINILDIAKIDFL